MSQLNIRIDDELKEKAEALFEELGIDMATAVNLFIRQAVRQGGIPFEVTTDPFHAKANMEVLKASIKEAEAGKVTAHKLIED